MIEDKKLGVKISENPMETLWHQNMKACEQRIKAHEDNLIIERKFLEMCKIELEHAKSDSEKKK